MKPFPLNFWSILSYRNNFFLDSTRHLYLHEMPHLIIKCSQLVILSTCFFWNSMSLLVKNIRTIQGYLRLSFLRLMYSNAVQIAKKTYENYLELSWKQGLMHFDIYVVVSRIDSCFFWGVTTHFSCTPGLQEIPFESLMNFLWIFMIFFCIVLKRSLCKSYEFLMQFLCIFDETLMHFLCNSYALLMQFLCSFKASYTFAKNVWSCKNCIRKSYIRNA